MWFKKRSEDNFSELSMMIKNNIDLPRLDEDLSGKIMSRIAQEERLREISGDRESFFERWFAPSLLNLAGVGALAAAAVIFVVAERTPTPSSQPQIATNKQSEVVTVSQSPKILPERLPAAIEIDWMRSDGRVTVINDRENFDLPVIWVKRNNRTDAPRILRDGMPVPHASLVEDLGNDNREIR